MTIPFRIALLLLLLASPLAAQVIHVDGAYAKNSAEAIASMVVLDSSGNVAEDLRQGDVRVMEAGYNRSVTLFDCSDNGSRNSISLVIMIDIGRPARLKEDERLLGLARLIANRVIDRLDLGGSEIAIGTSGSWAYINQDFTSDRVRLHKAVDAVEHDGASEITNMFMDTTAGVFAIERPHAHRKVALVISNAFTPPIGTESKIIDEALYQEVEVFAVVCGPAGDASKVVRPSLKQIAERRGGSAFVGVESEEDAERVARVLVARMQHVPCRIQWESAGICAAAGHAVVTLPRLGVVTTVDYVRSKDYGGVLGLDVQPSSLTFRGAVPGRPIDRDLLIRSTLGDVPIRAITTSDPRYTVVDSGGAALPYLLRGGEVRTIRIRYTPTDSAYSLAHVEIATDECFRTVGLAGGVPGHRAASSALRLLAPTNGGAFAAGAETTIAWDGVLSTDAVRIEYTTDDGATWSTIAEAATGLSYKWRLPAVRSEACRVRVGFAGDDTTLSIAGNGRGSNTGVVFTRDGSKVAVACGNGAASIWSAVTGELISEYRFVHPDPFRLPLKRVVWNPAGDRLVVVPQVPTPIVIDPATGRPVFTLAGHTGEVNSVAWSHDGALLASGAADTTIRIWSAADGHLATTLKVHRGSVAKVAFSPDDRRVASSSADRSVRVTTIAGGASIVLAHPGIITDLEWNRAGDRIVTASSDRTARVWDASSGALIATLAGHTAGVTRAAWNPGGTMIATSASDGSVRLWDPATGRQIGQCDGHSGTVYNVEWSPTGTMLASSGSDSTARIWDVPSGVMRRRLVEGAPILNVAWSPTGASVGVSIAGNGVADGISKVWRFDATPRFWRAMSDRPFRIGTGKLRIDDVIMPPMVIDAYADTVVSGFIRNVGDVPVEITGISNTVADFWKHGRDFNYYATVPSTVAPGESLAVDFYAFGYFTGDRYSPITITANGFMEEHVVRAGVYNRPFFSRAERIDFGNAPVGRSSDTMLKNTFYCYQAPIHFGRARVAGGSRHQFELLDGGDTFTLHPREYHTIAVRCRPDGPGRITARLEFPYDTIGAVRSIYLYADARVIPLSVGDHAESTGAAGAVGLEAVVVGGALDLECRLPDATRGVVALYDMLGREVRSQALAEASPARWIAWEISGLARGAYLVVLRGGGSIASRKVLID